MNLIHSYIYNMNNLYDDIILYICSHCDNISKYFMMQLNKRFARVINHYDINILAIKQYCILHDANGVYDWFVDAQMVNKCVTNQFAIDKCIQAAIMTRNNREITALGVQKLTLEQIKYAIKCGNNDIVYQMASYYLDNWNTASVSHIIESNNAEIMKVLLQQYDVLVTSSMLNSAATKPDIMNVFKPYVDHCVCYLFTKNPNIIGWCKSNSNVSSHDDFTDLHNAIQSGDNNMMMSVMPRYSDNIGMILPVMLSYIESNNFDKFKLMLNFIPAHAVVINNIIKYDRIEMLKYIINTTQTTINIVNVENTFKYGSIDLIKFLYDSKLIRSDIIRTLSVMHDRLYLLDWINSVDDSGTYYSTSDGYNMCCFAALTGKLELLKELRVRNYEWSSKVIDIAYARCDWRMLKWAYNNGCIPTMYARLMIKKIKDDFGNNFLI